MIKHIRHMKSLESEASRRAMGRDELLLRLAATGALNWLMNTCAKQDAA